MNTFKFEPKLYAGRDTENIAGVINTGFILFPCFLLIVLIRQIIQSDYDMAIFIVISILFTLIIRVHFLNGRLRQSVTSIAVFFNILLTIVCTLGNGINDIGLIGYPIIIGFSSIILDPKKLAFTAALSIIGISWLVIGEQLNFYKPLPPPDGGPGDFIISSLLIGLGGFVAFSLTNNMKSSLKSAQREITISKADAERLASEIDEKLEIISEIHRAVINSLNHIQQLIDHKQKGSNELMPVYLGLKRKVLVIEVAHNILLSDQAPIMLDIRELTAKLLKMYANEISIPMLRVETGKESCYVSLDQAINFGICMLELINEVNDAKNQTLSVSLKVENGIVQLILADFINSNESTQGIVMDLLTQQLKGNLIRNSHEISLTFTPVLKK